MLSLQFLPGETCGSLDLRGNELFDIEGLASLEPGQRLTVKKFDDGPIGRFLVIVRIDTSNELNYFLHGRDPAVCAASGDKVQ